MSGYKYFLMLLLFLCIPWANAAVVSYTSGFDYTHNPGTFWLDLNN